MKRFPLAVRAVLRLWLLSALAWSIPALLESMQAIAQARQAGGSTPFDLAFLRYAPKYYAWALLTPIVWYAAGRFPLDRPEGRIRNVAIHAAAAIALAALHLALSAFNYYAFWNDGGESLASVVSWYYANVFAFELLVYPVIIGAYHLIHYQRTTREQELEAARLEASLMQARFDALQSRLHPHFLFNSLNALIGLLRTDRNAEAIRAIGELGHLLRDALNDEQGQERTLEEELEWAERYLAIERLRIGPRLRVRFDVDGDALEAAVPRLLMQPLLENAVRHGIVGEPSAGEIVVSAARAGSALRIEVLDDGPGPADDARAADAGTESGVGLSTTRGRLRHLYGARGTLALGKRDEGGARVVVELPFRSVRGPGASAGTTAAAAPRQAGAALPIGGAP